MSSREYRWVVVAVLAALAVPAGSAAQNNDRHEDRPRRLTILQTTDLHDHANGADHVGLDVDPITGKSLTGSYARIAAYVKSVRATARHPVVLVDSGDWTMGTLYDLTLGDRPLALYFLELMHYNCVTLGNHEFDYSPKGLAQILDAARNSFAFRTPIVASNMDLGGNTDLAPFVGHDRAIETTRIEELPNGIKVGYLGLMGRGAALDAPASPPVSFWDPAAHYTVVQGLVDGCEGGASTSSSCFLILELTPPALLARMWSWPGT
jgi:2',3'-cyclic-nucleotide 2'-phosphodiesterase (5'-nucleotidase family)